MTTKLTSNVTISIDSSTRYQRMDGFGASGAWWSQDVGGWEDAAQKRVVSMLFDRDEGIGLSIYRYNIGGGANEEIADPWRRSECFGIGPGKYDWSRDRNAVSLLKRIHSVGVERIVAFANSPPHWMTRSGFASGAVDGGTNLDPDRYGDYAQFLVDVVRHLRDFEGVPVGWLSPINEPQWDWNPKKGQEGCHFEPSEAVAMARVMLGALQESGMDVLLSILDDGEWKEPTRYLLPVLDDAMLGTTIDHLAIHSYWSSAHDKQRTAALLRKRRPDLSIWMSEWTEMQQGVDIGMSSALHLANVVHDDLTLANVSSWQYWIAVSKYDFRDGLLYVGNGEQEVLPTKRLWALGQYSRFIRPGDCRVVATSSSEEVKVSGFLTDVEKNLVVIAVNNANHPQVIRFNTTEGAWKPANVFVTDETRDLKAEVPDAGAQLVLAPRSITTFVGETT